MEIEMKAVAAEGRDFAADLQRNTLGMRCEAGGQAVCSALKTDKKE